MTGPNPAERRAILRTLAMARAPELIEALAQNWPDLSVRDLKPAEPGLVMLRGRVGGDGAAFNLGEATVTRAVVELSTGERGYGFVLGRDGDHARCAAIFDALCQRPPEADRVRRLVLDVVEQRLASEHAQSRAATADTRVDFFTLVRGDT